MTETQISSTHYPPAERRVPMNGVEMIAAERRRQVEAEGWTPAHDDGHTAGELAIAAACYAHPAPRPLNVKLMWPWDREWWKPAVPGDRVGSHTEYTPEEIRAARIKDLRRAGALIAAEIDRLLRADMSREVADG